ncbi:proto-oncogene serine/threonine-protein kinase Pim-2 [Sarotherodon galilaeus]
MATVNMDAPGAEAVRVGVLLTTKPESKESVVIDEEGRSVYYKSSNNEAAKAFSFDQVVTVDSIKSFHPELLQPLTECMSSGCNAALLICGASTETTRALIDSSVIRQVVANLFSCMVSRVKGELFISVSSLQFYPDGSAVDLLSLNRQTLQPVTHPVLGSLIGGLCEVCVHSAEEAYNLYETCRETLKANAGSITSRCSSLFMVTVEWKLHPEEVESDVCRSRFQLFSLAGGASRTDLRGVNPLLKVLDQIPNPAANISVSLLPHLLNDALKGNSRTVLIYCINPQGLLDNETPSALNLAQKVRCFATKPTNGCWSPRATEKKIRDSITDLRSVIMSQGDSELHSIYELAELTQNLQMVKNQSWEKRREESEKIKVKIKTSNSNLLFSGDHHPNSRQGTDTMKCLQDQLRQEMEEHITEGKGNTEKVQERVARIQQLKEALREETLKSGAATENSPACQQSQLEYNKAEERRRQLKEDHGRLIQQEVEKMERDLAQENLPTEGPQRDLLVLTRERQVLVLQIEALRAEAQQAEKDLQDQYDRHRAELHCLREESLQVFRVFRQVSEEQRKISEGRYRSVLLEAVQDAIYLSAQNQQLQADNKQLRKSAGELKDMLAAQGDPMADLPSTLNV